MPSGTALARRSSVLLTTIVVGCAAAVPAAAVPKYARNEPAVAVAAPATVFLELTYTGYLRNTATGALVRPEPVVVTRRCSGVAVNPDGYVVSTTVCVQPSQEVLLVSALYRLGRTEVEQNELPANQLDTFVAGLKDSSTFTGPRRRAAPALRLMGQSSPAKSGATSAPAVTGVVVKALSPVAGNVALVKLRTRLPAIELAPAPDLHTGSSLDILGYALDTKADDPATYVLRSRTVEVTGRTGTNRIGVDSQIGPDSRGGPVVDAQGRLVGLLDTDSSADDEPIRDLIKTDYISRLLDQSGVDARLSEVDHAFRSALNGYFAGQYSQAIDRFDVVLRLDPMHAAAQAYRERAQERLKLDGNVAENAANWWLYLLSAVGGALIIGTTALVQRRLGGAVPTAAAGTVCPGDDAEQRAQPALIPAERSGLPASSAPPAPSSLEDTVVLSLPQAGGADARASSSLEDTVVLSLPQAGGADPRASSSLEDTVVLSLPQAGEADARAASSLEDRCC
ncbi:serine protease [Micromonospora sp. NPDC006431]|uniref:S1 family peptidase n=1 Tax=Micromonospora sp. NPDC006431 TaxID=3364235 RepID=UPI003692904D